MKVTQFNKIAKAKIKETPITAIVLSVCILVFVGLEVTGGSTNPANLLRWGAKSNFAIVENWEIWRLITSAFLHAGPLHLLINMVSLFLFSREVERIFGSLPFVVCWIFAAAGGNLASVWAASFSISSVDAVGVGASGAIFGTVGAFISYLILNRGVLGKSGRNSLVWALFIVVANILISSSIPNIDNAAHLGGLAAGLLVGAGISPNANKHVQWWGGLGYGRYVTLIEISPTSIRRTAFVAVISAAVIASFGAFVFASTDF